jgi:DNA-binding NarL/FixJ family response regulator
MNPPSPIRVALVEDSRAFAGELCAVLEQEQEIQCLTVCLSAAAARETLPGLAPDVVLMDMGLPDGSGAALLGELSPRMPKTDFVVLTVFDDDETIEQAILNGASGYLLKRSGGAKIVQAVRQVREGGAPFDNEVSRRLLGLLRERPQPATSLPELTAQENRLLRELSQGASVKEAAAAIGVTYASARTYVRRMYAKLGVRSRMAASRRFLNLDPSASGAAGSRRAEEPV